VLEACCHCSVWCFLSSSCLLSCSTPKFVDRHRLEDGPRVVGRGRAVRDGIQAEGLEPVVTVMIRIISVFSFCVVRLADEAGKVGPLLCFLCG